MLFLKNAGSNVMAQQRAINNNCGKGTVNIEAALGAGIGALAGLGTSSAIRNIVMHPKFSELVLGGIFTGIGEVAGENRARK